MAYIEDDATRRFGRVVHCLGGLITLGAVIVAYPLLYAPAIKATERARLRMDEIQHALQKAPGIALRHAQLSERLQSMERRLAEVRRRVPPEAEESEFLADLTSLAEEVGLAITNLSPGTPQQRGGYWQMDISVSGVADYESLCRFVERIRAFPRLTQIVELEVRHDPLGQGMYPVTTTVAIFFDLGLGKDEIQE